MTESSPLTHLSTALLIGTGRQPFALPDGLPESVQQLLTQTQPSSPEAALWQALATVLLYTQAGYQPTTVSAPEPAPADARPLCPPPAVHHLDLLLQGLHESLLPEWLRLADRHGYRAPPAHLPALLDLGRDQSNLRPLIIPLLDSRGRWLAAQNPDWDWVRERTQADPDALAAPWETAASEQRRALLARLRELAPDRARELVLQTWTADPPQDRAAFLNGLAAHLGPADEPLLEQALDDRRKEVREAALKLLGRLPNAQRVARLIARAEPLLNLERTLLGGQQLAVTLPETCDATMQRDGIKVPVEGLGEKAGWLLRLLAGIPPGHWSDRWQRAPAELIKLAESPEFGNVLLAAWLQAATRFQNADWQIAFMERLLAANPPPTLVELVDQDFYQGLRQLSEAPRRRLEQRLADGQLDQIAQRALLLNPDDDWSAALSLAAIRELQREFRHGNNPLLWTLRSVLAELAPRVAVEPATEYAIGWPDDPKLTALWQQPVNDFLTVIQFRAELRHAFTVPPS